MSVLKPYLRLKSFNVYLHKKYSYPEIFRTFNMILLKGGFWSDRIISDP